MESKRYLSTYILRYVKTYSFYSKKIVFYFKFSNLDSPYHIISYKYYLSYFE